MHAETTTQTAGNAGPARAAPVAKVETQVMGVAGAGLMLLAGFFLWRELQVRAEVLLVLGAAVAAVAATVLRRLKVQLMGPVLLLIATGGGALWYGATREPLLLAGLVVAFAAALVLAVLDRRTPPLESSLDRWHRLLSWHGVGVAGLVTSFSVYFQVFDASDLSLQDFVARRAILSLGWLLSGVGLVLFGRASRATELRDAGFLVLAAAVSKLLIYDTTHLDGLLRVGALAVAGVVLLGSAAVVRRLNTGARAS
jgi:hypothetical protein